MKASKILLYSYYFILCRSSGLVSLSLVASRFTPCERLVTAPTLDAFLEPRTQRNTPPFHPCLGGSRPADGGSRRIDMDVFHALPADIKQEVLTQPCLHKGRKPSTSSPDIKRYFTTHSGRDASGSREEDCAPPAKRQKGDEGEVCKKCQDIVPLWRMEEHRDYHFALELQREEEERHEKRVVKSHSVFGIQVGKKRPNSIQNFFARQ